MSEFYTVKQVAQLLQVSPKTIYDLVWKKKLAAVKVGYLVRISQEALDRYLAGEQVQAAPAKPVRSRSASLAPINYEFFPPAS